MTKAGKDRPEYSREREFKVLMEEIQSQFRTFGEGLETAQGKLDALEGLPQAVEQLQRDVIYLQKDMMQVQKDLGQVQKDLGQVMTQLSFVIDKALPTVATKDDLRQLEKRLTALEASR